MPDYVTKYRGVLTRSSWLPPSGRIPPEFPRFLTLANRAIHSFRPHHASLNLNQQQRAALQQLQIANLVVAPADKGSTAVVMPNALYHRLVTDHLSDRLTYELVDAPPDPQPLFLNAIGSDIHSLHPWVRRRLLQPGTRMATFYGLPKIHKDPLRIRPIVSSVNSPTYFWSKWIHAELWPIVRANPDMLVNSTDLAQRLSFVDWEEGLAFLNLDVVSLYTSIQHGAGMQAMMEFLRGDLVHDTLPDHPGTEWMSIVRVMAVVLDNNYFTWDGGCYHQLTGTAMGSPAAVVYANIFMFKVEQSHLANLIASSRLYTRFIDDLFFIVHDLQEAATTAASLNDRAAHPRVRWTHELSDTQAVMLDLDIRLMDGKLETRLNFKKTNRFAYVHPTSSHPAHTWPAVAIGELTRADRAASSTLTSRSTKAFLLDIPGLEGKKRCSK